MPVYPKDDKLGRWGLPRPLKRNTGMSNWFGNPCAESNLVLRPVPILGNLYVHELVADAYARVLTDIADGGAAALIDMGDYGGTYCCRNVRGSKAKSPHSWGVAIDLNVHHRLYDGKEIRGASTNFRTHRGSIAPSLAKLAPFFWRWGFAWGGSWDMGSSGRLVDPMHFEATELTVMLLGKRNAVPSLFNERMIVEKIKTHEHSLSVCRADGTLITNRTRMIDGEAWVPLREISEGVGMEVDASEFPKRIIVK